jgi:hypothetical protein
VGANAGIMPLINILYLDWLTVCCLVSGAVVALAVLVLLVRWWRGRRQEKREMGLKEEDRMPLSASFQHGELPMLSYLPEQKSATEEGVA